MGVKILLKNTLNIFKKKKIQLLAVGIIIALSSFLYTTMFYTLDSLKSPFEKFVSDYNQEDFSVEIIDGITKGDIESLSKEDKELINSMLAYSLGDVKRENESLYNNIIENRIDKFESEYDGFQLEQRVYKTVNYERESKGNKATFVKDGENINLSYIEKGNKPSSDNEIAITQIYAKKNNLELGDTIDINNKSYIITGYVLFPDITLPVSGKDFIIDNSKITLALVTDNEYENIKGKESIYFSGIVKNKSSHNMKDEKFKENYNKVMKNFDKKVVNTFSKKDKLDFIANITSTKNQIKSGAIYEELQAGQQATIVLSIIISSIAVMIILILIYKIIKNEKTQIGLLKSIGYSKNEILLPYLIVLLFISLPMLILGYIGGMYAANPMKNFYLDFYLLPNFPIQTNVSVLIIAICLPIIIILGLSYIVIRKMIYKKAVSLLKASEKEKISKLNKLCNKFFKDAKVQTKFKYSFIFNNTSKFVVFFIGILLSSMLIIMSFMMVGFFEKMTTDYYNNVDYVYEGYVDFTKGLPKLNDNEEPFISVDSVKYEGKSINIKGLLAENKLHKLYNKKDVNITEDLNNGVIINTSFSKIHNLKKGDVVELEINGQSLERRIANVSKDYGTETIYWRLEDIAEIITHGKNLGIGINENFFNAVYSKQKLDDGIYVSIINKNDIMDQSELMQKFIEISVYSMIGFAIFIAVLVLYILTTLTIEDNYYNISLLKVMGYSRKEVNSMILKSYLTYAVLSYFISIYLTVVGFNYVIKYMGRMFGTVMPFEFHIWHLFAGLIIIILIFILGTYAAKRRINKVSLQEVLKAYRE